MISFEIISFYGNWHPKCPIEWPCVLSKIRVGGNAPIRVVGWVVTLSPENISITSTLLLAVWYRDFIFIASFKSINSIIIQSKRDLNDDFSPTRASRGGWSMPMDVIRWKLSIRKGIWSFWSETRSRHDAGEYAWLAVRRTRASLFPRPPLSHIGPNVTRRPKLVFSTLSPPPPFPLVDRRPCIQKRGLGCVAIPLCRRETVSSFSPPPNAPHPSRCHRKRQAVWRTQMSRASSPRKTRTRYSRICEKSVTGASVQSITPRTIVTKRSWLSKRWVIAESSPAKSGRTSSRKCVFLVNSNTRTASTIKDATWKTTRPGSSWSTV